MAIIKAANERLADYKIKICLVTRSTYMHKIFSEEEIRLWEGSEGYVLRHPPCFSIFPGVASESVESTLERIEQMEKSVGLFLNSYDELCQEYSKRYTTNKPPAELLRSWSESLRSSILGIKEQWRLSIGLLSSLGEIVPVATPSGDVDQEQRAQLRRLLSLINNHERLTLEIKQRIGQLLDSMDRDYQLLSIEVHTQLLSQRGLIERHVRLEIQERSKRQLILSSSLYSMPYTLQFYTPELSDWAAHFEEKSELSGEEILHMFRGGITAKLGYERLLFIAYLFGMLNRWSLAEKYCDLALAEQQKFEQQAIEYVPPHEGLFFRAICLRNHQSSENRYRKAMQCLFQARINKGEALGAINLEDPRFLVEQANLIFAWNEKADKNMASEVSDEDAPPTSEALSILKRALELIRDDNRLKAKIFNNLCYYCSEVYMDVPSEEVRVQAQS